MRLNCFFRLDPLFDFVRSANERFLRSIRPNSSSAVLTQSIVSELVAVMQLMTFFKLWRGDRLMLVRIASCLATSQIPESTQSNPVVRVGCSVSNSSWSVTSKPTLQQLMLDGLQCAPIAGFHHAHQCRRLEGE